MRLQEIEEMLPNGFHDARLERISLDYVERKAKFDFQISVGTPEGTRHGQEWRFGQLTLSGLVFCVIELPDSSYPYRETKPLWVDAGPADSAKLRTRTRLPEPIPEGAFSYWFFVNDWNSFIHVAAINAVFSWR